MHLKTKVTPETVRQAKPDAARLNERLDVAPLNLQKLFVKLTEKEEAR